jgi:hypothetical protein
MYTIGIDPAITKQNCKTCIHAKQTCLPPNISIICDKRGIGLQIRDINVIECVGCASYNYDMKGLTDKERKR